MMVWSFKSVVPCSKAGNLFTLFRWLFTWDCRLEVLPSEVVFFVFGWCVHIGLLWNWVSVGFGSCGRIRKGFSSCLIGA